MSRALIQGMILASDAEIERAAKAGESRTSTEHLAMRAAVRYLAENISDGMVFTSVALPNDPKIERLRLAFKDPKHRDTVNRTRASIARAIKLVADER